MDITNVLAAGVATGTVLLFAAIGEIFAERAGVLNLGVEGMMLFGAVSGFSTGVATGDPWLGLLVAMLAGGLLSMVHAVMTISLRADQVVSGLALTFLGTGLARVLGEGVSSARNIALIPQVTIPILSDSLNEGKERISLTLTNPFGSAGTPHRVRSSPFRP